MIKRLFQKTKELLCSLRIRFVIVFLIAVAIGIGVYFTAHYLSYGYINDVYTNEENKKEREMSFISDLQSFVTLNNISSENTAKLSEWARDNKYVYLLIYRDNELFYTSDDIPKEPPEDSPEQAPEDSPEQAPEDSPEQTPEDSPEQTPEDSPEQAPEDSPEQAPEDGPEQTPEQNPEENPEGSDSEGSDSDKDSADTGKKPDDNTNKNPGGVTIDYPTREELFAYAQKNDLHPLELADGTMFASLTEFTEYLYYDISNIASLVIALVFVLIILTSYFQMVTTKIIRLGNEVNKVADGDVSHVIKSKGKDEIARLSHNVDNMRESMIENFRREREAIDANTELITSMSHDIRTPLTVLLGYIDVMQTRAENDAEMQGYLKAAESTAMRLKKLSDDMFGYFLVFAGKELEIKMEAYDAATLIDQMLFEHVTLMRESGYRVEFSGLDYASLEGDGIYTDAQKLIRIFDNVFSNIYKYADKGSKVSITAEKGEGLLVVSLCNVISKESGRAESNGIGLKTCKKLGEYIGADFKYEANDEIFTATLALKIQRKSS